MPPSAIEPIYSGDGEIQGKCSEENFPRFGECGRCVIGQKRTKRRQQKRYFRCPSRNQALRHVCDKEASADVHEHLNNQDCAIVLHTKDGEYPGEKRGISRQPDIGGRNPVTAQSVNSMLQPVLGNVPIDKGVGRDCRKTENEQQPQGQG
jgi:hypothetical protein